MFDPSPIPMICKFCISFDGVGWCSRVHKEVLMYSFCDDFELRSKEFYEEREEEGEGEKV